MRPFVINEIGTKVPRNKELFSNPSLKAGVNGTVSLSEALALEIKQGRFNFNIIDEGTKVPLNSELFSIPSLKAGINDTDVINGALALELKQGRFNFNIIDEGTKVPLNSELFSNPSLKAGVNDTDVINGVLALELKQGRFNFNIIDEGTKVPLNSELSINPSLKAGVNNANQMQGALAHKRICWLLDIKYFFYFALLFISMNSFAATYYVSNSGNDLNNGTSAASAWQTIGKLNTITFQPGDSILFASGETFRGQWVFNGNGAGGSSVYIGIYGGTAKAVISGSMALSGWQPNGNSIVDVPFNQWCHKLIVNGTSQTLARYPNSGFLTISAAGGNDNITCNALTQSGAFFVNSNIRIRTANAYYETTQIDSLSNGNQLYFNNPVNTTPQAGFGFYLDNNAAYIDTAGEWYCDTVNHFIYYQPASGVSINSAEASVLDYGILFDSSADYISINNISFANQYISGINFLNNATGVVINNCSFKNQEMYGIYEAIQISGSVIKNDSFTNINGNGIWCNSIFGDSVSYNDFRSIGARAGQGTSGYSSATAIFSPSATYSVFSYDRFDTTGYAAINVNGTGNVIQGNFIKSSVYTLSDGAAILNNGTGSSQATIKDNFIYNTLGNSISTNDSIPTADGILLDNNCSYITIQNNTIVNTATNGIFINGSNNNHLIQNNVVYNSGYSQIYFVDSDTLHGNYGNVVNGNTFYCLNDAQNSLTIYGEDSLFHPAILDANYYCNPYSYYPILFIVHDTFPINNYPYNLNQWQQFYGNDINSHVSLIKFRTFNLLDTLAPNLIVNGDFTNNTDNWSSYPLNNNMLLLDNSVGLDGGCLKIAFLEGSSFPFCEFASSNISVEGGQYYLFKISLVGTGPKYLEAYCKKEDLYYFVSLGFDKYYPIPIDSQSANYSDIFQANQDYTPAQLSFKMFYFDSTLWVDNVSLQEVSVIHNDSSKLSRLIANYSSSQNTFSLGDSIYRDLNGNVVASNIVVSPYSSVILVYDSLLSASILPNLKVNNKLNVYPNPINPSENTLTINTLESITETPIISLFDMYGRAIAILESNQKNGNSFNVKLPSTLATGSYIIEFKNSKESYSARIVVTTP